MAFNSCIVLILALSGIFILPLVLIFIVTNKRKLVGKAKILLALYSILIVIGVFTKVVVTKNMVTITLDFSSGWLNKHIKWGIDGLNVIDAIINLIMLIPVGIALYIFYEDTKPLKYIIFIALIGGLIIGLVIEVLQFILPCTRSVQLTDVILNAISLGFGAVLGNVYYKVTKK